MGTKATMEMLVRLPSEGKPYGGTGLEDGVVLRMITGGEEKKIYGSGGGTGVLDAILDACIVRPKFDLGILLPADKQYLLMMLRVHSYGASYRVVGINPVSGEEEEHLIDLNEVPVIRLESEWAESEVVELPVSGEVVEVRVLRSSDHEAVRRRVERLSREVRGMRAGEVRYISRIAQSVVSVEGRRMMANEAELWVQNLVGRDISAIKRVQERYIFGLGNRVKVVSPNNGEEYEVPVVMTSDFFRSFDD